MPRKPFSFRPATLPLENRTVPATIVVNSLADGPVNLADATVTLRDAIAAANTDAQVAPGGPTGSGADVIEFAPSLTAGGPAVITLTQFDAGLDSDEAGAFAFRISTDITLLGPASGNGITIRRDAANANAFRLFYVYGGAGSESAARLAVENLTLSGGRAVGGDGAQEGGGGAGMGGGIFNRRGTVVLTGTVLTGNSAEGGDGGAYLGSIPADPSYAGEGGGGMGAPGVGRNGGGPNGGGNFGDGGFGGGGGRLGSGGLGGGGGDRADGGFGGGGGGRADAGFGGGDGSGRVYKGGGGGAGMGGAVFNLDGILTVTGSTISNNTAIGGAGVSAGTDSSQPGSGLGGAVFTRNGTVTVINSTLSGNTAAQGGGALFAVSDGAGGDGFASGTTAVTLTGSALTGTAGGASDFAIATINGAVGPALAGSANTVGINGAYTTLVVTTTDDEADTEYNPADLSLREAVLLANLFTDANTITFAPSLVASGDATLALSIIGDGTAGPSALGVTTPITIQGPTGDNGITLAGGGSTSNLRAFFVGNTGTLTLQNLTVRDFRHKGGDSFSGGGAAGLGGAIFVDRGILTVERSTFVNNTANGGSSNVASAGTGGGGLGGAAVGTAGGTPNGGATSGTGGFGGGGGGATSGTGGAGGFGGGGGTGGAGSPGGAGGFGGGGGAGSPGGDRGFGGGIGSGGGGGGAGLGGAIFSNGGSVTLINSTLTGNAARGGGAGPGSANGSSVGGAVFSRNGTLAITNSTLSGNTASNAGKQVAALGDGNRSSGDPLDASASTATTTLTNSVLGSGGPPDGVSDLFSVATDGGTQTATGDRNLIRASTGFTGTSTLNGDPRLGGLADNGGPTPTMLPQPGSPLINPVGTTNAAGLVTDQRGAARVVGATIDLGAVETGEPPTVNLSVSATAGTEAGQTVITVTATASSAVTGDQTVDLTVTGSDITSDDYTLSSPTVTILGGQTSGSVTFTVTDDAVVEGTETATLTISNPSLGIRLGVTTSQTVTITDDDTAGVSVTQSGGTTAVAEGGATDTFTVVLTSQPTADVTVTVAGGSQAGVSPATLTFTAANWNVAQTVTVTAVNDAVAEGTHSQEVTFTTASSDVNYNALSVSPVTASITDDDTAGITVTQSGGTTAVAEGGATDTFTTVLTSQPTADVTVTVTGGSQTGVAPTPLVFTATNWNVAQTVTVTATDDDVAEGTHTQQITFTTASGDTNYNARSVGAVTASITDNDTAGVTVTQSGGTTAVTEGGATDSFTVVLTSQPTADVTIAVAGGLQASATPTVLTFTAGNWNVPQTVTVTAVDDALIESPVAQPITLTVTSSDPSYDGYAVSPVTADVADNDVPSIAPIPVPTFSVGSGPGTPAEVKLYNSDGTLARRVNPFGDFTGGVAVATGDLDGDGVNDIVAGAGVGGGPRILVLSGATGEVLADFFAFESSFRGGVWVAVGDVTGDGRNELIVGAGIDGGPRVRVLRLDGSTIADFFSAASDLRSGVTVAASDLTGDGIADVVTGVGGQVLVFAGGSFDLVSQFDTGLSAPISVSVAGGTIYVGSGLGAASEIREFTASGQTVETRSAVEDTFTGGIRIAAADLNLDGNVELIVGAAPGGGPRVRVLGTDLDFFAFDADLRGGVFVG